MEYGLKGIYYLVEGLYWFLTTLEALEEQEAADYPSDRLYDQLYHETSFDNSWTLGTPSLNHNEHKHF